MSGFCFDTIRVRYLGWAAFVVLVASTAGCSGGGPTVSDPPATSQTTAVGGSAEAAETTSGTPALVDGSAASTGGTDLGCGAGISVLAFDPANFVDPLRDTNPYHPLKPGTQWVRGGSTLVGNREVPHQVISTITDVIRVIDGVPTVAMLDESTDAGEVSQVGLDYLALDKAGNVWLLGGYTEEYEGGEYTNHEDAWLGASGGARIGVLSPAQIDPSSTGWCIGGAPEDDQTVGVPIEFGASECVAFGCYDDVRIIQEGLEGAPDNEYKYYAPGVGVIRNVPLNASLHKDRFELENLVLLSPDGLAEASQTALDLEAHARTTAAEVFGTTPESLRAT